MARKTKKTVVRFVPKVAAGDSVVMQKDSGKVWTVRDPAKFGACDYNHHRYYALKRGSKTTYVRGDKIHAAKNGTFVSNVKLNDGLPYGIQLAE